MKGDQARRVFDACGMQQHALNNAEDGGVRTDAKGEGEDGDDGEERGVKKTKQSLPEIGQEHVDLNAVLLFATRSGAVQFIQNVMAGTNRRVCGTS